MLSDLFTIKEYTLKDLKREIKGAKSGTHAGVTDRSKLVNVKFQGISNSGVMRFHSNAVTTTGQDHWVQRVKLVDFEAAIALVDSNMTLRDRANLAIFGDLQCACNCPAYGFWGYKYIASQLDYNQDRAETRAPKVRNPMLQGAVCKHLSVVLDVLPFHIGKVSRKIKKLMGAKK